MSVFSLLERGATRCNGRPFLVGDHAPVSYAEALAQARLIAGALRARGFGPLTQAAVLSHNDPRAVVAWYGIIGAGMTYAPANPRNAPDAIVQSIRALDVSVLFYQGALAPLLQEIRPQLSDVRLFVALDDALPGDTTLAQFIAGAEPAPSPTPLLEDAAFLGQTGGTTGEPKGVVLSHRAVMAFVEKFIVEFPDPAPVLLAATPLMHAAGMLAQPVIAQGGTIVLMAQPDLPRFLDLIGQHRVTMTFLPPTAIYRLLDVPDVRTRDYSSLRVFLYGAAPMSIARLKQALDVFGPVMTQSYGQTECHSLIALMRPEDHFDNGVLASDARLSACGRPSLGTTVVIKDDDGRRLADGEVGEICVHSDLMMSRYFLDPVATAEAIRSGFLHTGDIGFLDSDGFLHIVDRKKDLIITGGFNVYPSEVEQAVMRHAGVADCCCIGLPDEDWGEAVTIVVERAAGSDVSEAELVAFCRPLLGGVKTPKRVEFWRTLPRSAVGKVLRKDVRAKVLAKQK